MHVSFCHFRTVLRAEGVNTSEECLSVVFTVVDEYQLFVVTFQVRLVSSSEVSCLLGLILEPSVDVELAGLGFE